MIFSLRLSPVALKFSDPFEGKDGAGALVALVGWLLFFRFVNLSVDVHAGALYFVRVIE